MEVARIAVDEISCAEGTAIVVATVFDFMHRPQWITTYPDVEGERLGPVTLPDGAKQLDTSTVRMTSLGTHTLHLADDRDASISHRTDWTVDPATLYAVVLPPDYVVASLSLHAREFGDVRYSLGVTAERRVFAYAVFMQSGVVTVELLGRLDQRRAKEVAEREAIVRGTRRYEDLARSATTEVLQPGFVLRLLEFGSRMAGMH
jgi:hypothetical protein